ncbi:hypothetical protein F5Y18DRAFT_425904 [Xylariaceae sp. FL1019]|nr:hypothetical protein F5Y18DRAFT_425904 [Xylariaceae sp. FL1019]
MSVPASEKPEITGNDIDMVNQFFHLDEASLPLQVTTLQHLSSPVGDNALNQEHGKGEIPGFVPITGQKTDQSQYHVQEASKDTNRTGGEGPFVFPHSPDVFMGGLGVRRRKPFVPNTSPVRGTAKKSHKGAVEMSLDTAQGAAHPEDTEDTALKSPVEETHEEVSETSSQTSGQKVFEPSVETTHDWMQTRQFLLSVMKDDEF